MNEDFDIVKWREENPMDYLKTVELINSYSDPKDKNNVFETIYKITRLHIPDTLYKFISLTDDKELNEEKLKTFRQQQIFMSDAKYLNDPFDNKAFFYDPQKLSDIERLAPHGGKLIDNFSTMVKVSALTTNDYTSMPMWAHYANNHNGFCISYDPKLKENAILCGTTFPVQYTNKRIDITESMKQYTLYVISEFEKQSIQGKARIDLDDLSMLFRSTLFYNIKHETWAYEKEFRSTVGESAKNMPYLPAIPKEVYVGLKCADEYVTKIKEIAELINIPAYRTVFDELNPEFTLSLERI